MLDKNGNVKRIVMRLLWFGVILVSIKSIFTDSGFDNGYQIAMSFRHLNGDEMFATMWEPHQTSAFLVDILMWLYGLIVPSYTGVTLFIQIVGTLIFVALCVPVYKTLKPYCGENITQLMCMFLIVFRAKQTPFVEFANMQVLFTVVLFLCLVKFFESRERYIYLYLAALALCLEVLSYPSCLIMYLAVIVILMVYAQKKAAAIVRFSVPCLTLGVLYVTLFLSKSGLDGFINNVKGMLSFDSHSEGKLNSGLWVNTKELLLYLLWVAASYAVSLAVVQIVKRLRGKQYELLVVFALVMFVSEMVLVLANRSQYSLFHKSIYILPLLLMGLGIYHKDNLSQFEKGMFLGSIVLSFTSMISVALLSDLSFDTFLPYMVIGAMISFMAIGRIERSGKQFLVIVIAIVLFHRGIVINGYLNYSYADNVFQMENIIRNGPNLGIVTDYDNLYMMRDAGPELNALTNENDCVLVVTYDWIIDPVIFLYIDGKIANPSVIDTPIYNEALLDYIRLHPEKKPTAVAVLSPYGYDGFSEESWIVNWIESEYSVADTGNYWKVYR